MEQIRTYLDIMHNKHENKDLDYSIPPLEEVQQREAEVKEILLDMYEDRNNSKVPTIILLESPNKKLAKNPKRGAGELTV